MVRIGAQTMSLPPHDEIHISCAFTWDMDYCKHLQEQYQAVTDKPVLLGGPAYESPCDTHTPGLYTKTGVIFTSRGCNNNCPWCFVPKREGKLRELPILPGNIVNDNNFLQCSRAHQQAVFDMLHTQRRIEFVGGLETRLINTWFAQRLAELQAERRLKQIFLACDTTVAIKPLQEALGVLAEGGLRITHNYVRCYVLCYAKDIKADEERLRAVYEAGAMPRCQLYRAPERAKTAYPPSVERWARQWQRPAATIAHMERGTQFEEYGI
jgi:hypothetical protein